MVVHSTAAIAWKNHTASACAGMCAIARLTSPRSKCLAAVLRKSAACAQESLAASVRRKTDAETLRDEDLAQGPTQRGN